MRAATYRRRCPGMARPCLRTGMLIKPSCQVKIVGWLLLLQGLGRVEQLHETLELLRLLLAHLPLFVGLLQ